MNKFIPTAIVAAVLMTGCSALTPAENIQALREVNAARVELELAKEARVKAVNRLYNADEKLIEAESRLGVAVREFEIIHFGE